MIKKESINKILVVSIFAIAMAFLETTVVIYLRKLLYPEGFNFPLKAFIDPSIINIEWVREFATIVMLIAIGILAGKKLYSKIAYFLLAFAVWDIFYYVFLKITLNWPDSFFTWDLLFLIPWPWIGPVLAPLLCTILILIASFMIIKLEDNGFEIKLKKNELFFIILGVIVVLYTWLYDYGKIILFRGYAKSFFNWSTNLSFIETINNYLPSNFNWILFLIGLVISSLAIIKAYLRIKKR
ncbi:MAG: hypothetical protein PHF67_02925 [Candidatus Nanoarchaeia archaeon]|nr:hypothetical protein [Candidatus Nanoarchaeia archaeon]